MADLSLLPQCGIDCLVSSLPASICNITDQACLCTDEHFADVVQTCVLGNCSAPEALVTKNVTAVGCGYTETNQDTTIIVLTVVLFSLQSIFFALRMLCRAVRIAPWGMDDTTIVIAFLATTGFLGATIIEQRNGVGRDVWTLSPVQITSFLKVFYIFEVLYAFTLGMVKISICFLYLRIFPGRKFYIAVWATQAFNVALIISYMVTDFVQCRPLSFFWQGWDGLHAGYCLNINAIGWSHALINIVLDVWMLILPATQVWHLNVAWRKRAWILAMFSFGIFLTVISIVRLRSLPLFYNRTLELNPTRDLFGVAMWSCVEITAGLMVACMPAARLFVVRYVPRLFTWNRSGVSEIRYPNDPPGSGPQPGGHSKDKDEHLRSSITSNSSTTKVQSKLTKSPTPPPLSPKDLDKNRKYSSQVTVTSNGHNGDLSNPIFNADEKDAQMTSSRQGPHADELELNTLNLSEFPAPGSSRLPRPGEYLGVPERLLTPPSSPPPASTSRTQKRWSDGFKKIWVRQDVSITRSSAASIDHGEAKNGGWL